VGPIANLSSPLQLFLNPSRIQILTQFFCGSHFLPLLAPPSSFLPFLSLSSTASLLSLSLLSAISRPLHRRRQTKTKQKCKFIFHGQAHNDRIQTKQQNRNAKYPKQKQTNRIQTKKYPTTRPHQAHNDPEASSRSQNPDSSTTPWISVNKP
jgi:hypothetical protein